MAAREPVPRYEYEEVGMKKLASTLELMKRSNYSPLLAKAAYLFCSIIDGHHFSNGNKRLAVALLTYFLMMNGYDVHVPLLAELQRRMKRVFPKLIWEHIDIFALAEEYFFYHLALVIADRNQKGNLTFSQEQTLVRNLLKYITR
ncbi:MAG: type II toxin-antitoxin system death-on-curing family toxin [Candidatus Peregrinibacteria bacterium]